MQIEPDRAVAHLCAADPVLARVIAAAGPFAMRPDGDNPFRSLSRSIVYQQLSGKAAATIYRRFVGLFVVDGGDGDAALARSDPDWGPLFETFPAPAAVLALTDEQFRAAGLSRQKTAALRSLAEHFASGELGREQFAQMSDDEVVAHLTRVRGIGVWSAQMFLMFHLRRPDVLPVNDLGVNRAIMRQYGLAAMPSRAEVLRVGAPWHPWATVACWYMWRSEDTRLPTGEA